MGEAPGVAPQGFLLGGPGERSGGFSHQAKMLSIFAFAGEDRCTHRRNQAGLPYQTVAHSSRPVNETSDSVFHLGVFRDLTLIGADLPVPE
jgi:hypothetical protein